MKVSSSRLGVLLQLVAPALIWFGHFNTLYAVVTVACRLSFDPMPAILVATFLALALLFLVGRSSLASRSNGLARWSMGLLALSTLGVAWSVFAALLAPSGC